MTLLKKILTAVAIGILVVTTLLSSCGIVREPEFRDIQNVRISRLAWVSRR